MARQSHGANLILDVSNFNRLVLPGSCDGLIIAHVGDAADNVLMPRENRDQFQIHRVPEPNRFVGAAADQQAPLFQRDQPPNVAFWLI